MDNSTPDNNDDLLVRYLDNELDPAEKKILEEKITADPGLRQQLEDLQLAREAVIQYGLKEKVSGIHQEMMKELQTPVRSISSFRKVMRVSMSVAAGIVLLVGAFLVYNFFSLSADGFYLSHYQAYEVSTVRNEGGTGELEKAYREKRYSDVVSLHASGGNDARSDFLTAMSQLQLNDPPAAIRLLEKAVKSPATAPQVKEEAEYYLALAYVKNRDFDLAIPLLEKIKDAPDHLYNGRVSAKMIRQVKMLKWR